MIWTVRVALLHFAGAALFCIALCQCIASVVDRASVLQQYNSASGNAMITIGKSINDEAGEVHVSWRPVSTQKQLSLQQYRECEGMVRVMMIENKTSDHGVMCEASKVFNQKKELNMEQKNETVGDTSADEAHVKRIIV
ncbi:MAG: hypothetical protein DI535_22750 [Citrobacter freundii]|nr:MAG: hypothetical protein DI535_22750 [Citrobacter freundii]